MGIAQWMYYSAIRTTMSALLIFGFLFCLNLFVPVDIFNPYVIGLLFGGACLIVLFLRVHFKGKTKLISKCRDI